MLKSVEQLGGDKAAWAKGIMTKGLEAYEKLAARSAGRYSVGDAVTLADVCLVPVVWNAERYGVELRRFPTVMKVFGSLSELQAVKDAHWKNQPDTPEELRC